MIVLYYYCRMLYDMSKVIEKSYPCVHTSCFSSFNFCLRTSCSTHCHCLEDTSTLSGWFMPKITKLRLHFVKVIQTDLLAFLLDTVYDKRPHISGYLRNGVAVGEKWKLPILPAPLQFDASYALNPTEIPTNLIMVSSLATFLSPAVKSHMLSSERHNMYLRRDVRKSHFKLNQAFRIIQGHPYCCRQKSRRGCRA